jgi:hypothetical protein
LCRELTPATFGPIKPEDCKPVTHPDSDIYGIDHGALTFKAVTVLRN